MKLHGKQQFMDAAAEHFIRKIMEHHLRRVQPFTSEGLECGYHPEELGKVWLLRKAVNGVPPAEAMELLLSRLKKHKTNVEFLLTLQPGQ